MLRRYLVMAAIGVCALGAGLPQLHAQPPNPALDELRTAIGRGVGAEPNTLAVKLISNVLIVQRINSKMNSGSHDLRDNEATAIASITSKAIAGKPEFKKLVALRVEYVSRPAVRGKASIIDTIEFREDPNGGFIYHKT
jgi:hypothetical protein